MIIYSGEPSGSYPIPRDVNKFCKNADMPLITGFFQFASENPIILKHGEFHVQIECSGGKTLRTIREGEDKAEWKHDILPIIWKQIDFSVQDVEVGTQLCLSISQNKYGGMFGMFGIEKYKRLALLRHDLPIDMASIIPGKTDLRYWPDLNSYTSARPKITCGYCLRNDPQDSIPIQVKGLGGKLSVGNCCYSSEL